MKAAQIKQSDKNIKEALDVLQSTHRGQCVLGFFYQLTNNPMTQGLDGQGMEALVTLTNEFALTGRRDFIGGMKKVLPVA